jgi:hypothetical protein
MKHALRFETEVVRVGTLLLGSSFLLLTICTAQARILRTRPTPLETWDPFLPLTIGSAIEFETDNKNSQYSFPMLLEYNFTEPMRLTIEPNIGHIDAKAKDARTVTGVGDLETALEYEFVRERRYRPAFTAEGVIKWPTASDRDIGDPGHDYSIGLIVSKDLVFIDLDLSATYTLVGDSNKQDTLELSVAAEWHLNYRFDVEAEIVHTIGSGGIRGQPGTLAGIGPVSTGVDLTEGTVGVAWHVTKRLKIEQGAVFRSDGTWQIVFAWEWSFFGQ